MEEMRQISIHDLKKDKNDMGKGRTVRTRTEKIFRDLLPVMAILLGLMLVKPLSAAGTYTEPGSYSTNDEWAEPVKCHVISHDDGTSTLIYAVYQDQSDQLCFYVRHVRTDGNDINLKKIDVPGEIWGGCVYQGPDGCYYVATGSETEGNDSDPVIYITKYNGEWNFLGQAIVPQGYCDLGEPFAADSCDMGMYGNHLIIHVGKEDAELDDGFAHQSVITVIIDTGTMTPELPDNLQSASFFSVGHCFNSFVRMEGEKVFFVDHVDAGAERGVNLQSFRASELMGTYDKHFRDKCRSKNLFPFFGVSGDNITGATVDGVEKTKGGLLVAGTSIPHDRFKSNDDFFAWDDAGKMKRRNIYVIPVKDDQELSSSLVWLTNFTDKTYIKNLKMFKAGENDFYLLYGLELPGDKEKTCYMHINGQGSLLDQGSMDREFFCTCEPDMKGNVITWCHYVESALGYFLVWNSWNIANGTFRIRNLPINAKTRISKYTLSYPGVPIEVGNDEHVFMGIYSDVFLNLEDEKYEDWDLAIAPVVWKTSNPSVLAIVREESITNQDIDEDEGSSEAEVTIKPLKAGKATITCEIGQVTKTATITVKGASGSSSKSSGTSQSGGKNASVKTKVPATKISKLKQEGKDALLVKWKKKNVKGYQIQYALNKKFTKGKKSLVIKKKGTTKKKLKKLKAGKKYFVRIRCWKKTGKKKTYSAWSKIKTVKIK